MAHSVHQVAVILYNNNPDLSSSTSSSVKDVHTWEPPKGASDPNDHWDVWWTFNPNGPATLYSFPAHLVHQRGKLPSRRGKHGRLLGRVPNHRRRCCFFYCTAQARGELDAVYLHPDRQEVTYRICLLTDVQKRALMDFLQAKEGGNEVPCPLPILPDETNTQRVDPEEPIRVTGVFRDAWDRVTLPPEWMGDGRSHCMWNPLDFPTKADHLRGIVAVEYADGEMVMGTGTMVNGANR